MTTDPTPKLLAELKEKAEKATPEFIREGSFIYGPKHPASKHPNGRILIADIIEGSNQRDPHLDGGTGICSGENDAAYIAAANPSVMLALIARLEELEANNYGPEILNDPQALTTAYFAGEMAAGRRQNVENDKLQAENDKLKAVLEMLNEEADWLAQELAGNVVPKEEWRMIAHEVVKKR